MTTSLPENHINRIDIPVDRSKCTRKEIKFLELASDLGEFELNARCNNRLARITELEGELSAIDDPIRGDKIKDEIQSLRLAVEDAKRQGVFQDYGLLKRRIAEGASADEVYSMMPPAYAMVCDRVRSINARPVKREKSLIALLAGTTSLGALANIITIKDSDVLSSLKELLQAFLRI